MNNFGSHMEAEIREIPAVIERIAACPPVARVGTSFAVVAHGSSLNAAGIAMDYLQPTGITARVMTPQSAHTVADNEQIIAVSQSGATHDVLDWLALQDRQHFLLTNNDQLPSHGKCDVVHLNAGPELAVCATKTVIATMMTMDLMLLGGYSQSERIKAWQELGGSMDFDATLQEFDEEGVIDDVVSARAVWVVGEHAFRPAAQEIALKLMESSGRLALALATIEGQHGPVVAIQDSDVILWAGDYQSQNAYGARTERMHLLPTTGNGQMDEILDAAATLVSAQLLSLQVARRLGCDPDSPVGLNKVTNP